VDDLISKWRAAWAEWAEADAAGKSVRTRNRIMDRIWSLGHEIAAHPQMHGSINALCDPEQDPDLRLGAALVREHWDVAGAAETLVSVIQGSGASIPRPVTMAGALKVKSTATARTGPGRGCFWWWRDSARRCIPGRRDRAWRRLSDTPSSGWFVRRDFRRWGKCDPAPDAQRGARIRRVA